MNPVAEIDLHPSDSRVQNEIAVAMLDRLGKQQGDWRRLEWKAAAAELSLPPVWRKANPDSVWKRGSEFLVVECYARIGELKSGHRRKLAMDVLKLVALVKAVPEPHRAVGLLVVPTELHERLKGEGWFIEALRLVEIIPIALLDDERTKLKKAASRQADGQARITKQRR